MTRAVLSLVAVLLLSFNSEAAFSQTTTNALAASLQKEEQMLVPGTTITESDIARLQGLADRIRAAKDAQLLSRAELLLVLFREQLHTKAQAAAYDNAIKAEARTIRRDQWHRTKSRIVRTSFWIGLSSLGLIGVSQAVNDWATNRYLTSPTASSATPYFVTGKVAQLGSLVGIVGAVGGLGTAWLLEVNPFDIPAARTESFQVGFPRDNMTNSEKLSFLNRTRKDYTAREIKAERTRRLSFGMLAAGLTGVLATGISGYLGNLAYNKYVSSTTASDAANYRNMVSIYQDITVGTASLALVGLGGATVGYLFGPDPATLASSIATLDRQIALLQNSR